MTMVNERNISQQMPIDDEDYCAVVDIFIDCNESVYENDDFPGNGVHLEMGISHQNGDFSENEGSHEHGDSPKNDVYLKNCVPLDIGDLTENRGSHEHGDPHKNEHSCDRVASPDNHSSASQPWLCKVKKVVITLVVVAFIMIISIAAVEFVRSETTQENLTTGVTYQSKGMVLYFYVIFIPVYQYRMITSVYIHNVPVNSILGERLS